MRSRDPVHLLEWNVTKLLRFSIISRQIRSFTFVLLCLCNLLWVLRGRPWMTMYGEMKLNLHFFQRNSDLAQHQLQMGLIANFIEISKKLSKDMENSNSWKFKNPQKASSCQEKWNKINVFWDSFISLNWHICSEKNKWKFHTYSFLPFLKTIYFRSRRIAFQLSKKHMLLNFFLAFNFMFFSENAKKKI